MRTTLLTCNLTPEENGRLRFVCMRMQVLLREVSPAEFGATPAQLLGGKAVPAAEESAAFGEGLLIMCGFSSPQMDMLLKNARGIPLKAVLTPTNRDWPLTRLYAELAREREAFRKG